MPRKCVIHQEHLHIICAGLEHLQNNCQLDVSLSEWHSVNYVRIEISQKAIFIVRRPGGRGHIDEKKG